jgi:hypothetical protein
VYDATLKLVVALTAAWHAARLGKAPRSCTPASQLVGVLHLPKMALWPAKKSHDECVTLSVVTGPLQVALLGESSAA